MTSRTLELLCCTPHAGAFAPVETLVVQTDPDVLDPLNSDAAAMHGKGASGLIEPRNEAELARWLRENPLVPVIVQGALTSLSAGATPDRDVVISTRKLATLQVDVERRVVVAEAGVVLANLQEALAAQGLWYPPAPTHDGASIGGNVATNAAGAATFKHGSTRDWIQRLRMVLRNGDTIEVRRGQMQVGPGDRVRLHGTQELVVEIPQYVTPNVRKISAGYFVRAPMDFLDLLIGAEGTLGIVTEVEARVLPKPKVLTGLVFFGTTERAIEFVLQMRERSLRTRASAGGVGIDVRSIEFFDHRCLELLRDDGKLSEHGVTVPEDAGACLLFEQELGEEYDTERVMAELAGEEGGQGAVAELMALLQEFDVVETCELAMPEQTRRQKQLAAMREAVPLRLSDWLKQQQRVDAGVHKAGGDMIVPMERFAEMIACYGEAFGKRGIDVVVFGHISDGNVHPNALPRDAEQTLAAKEALLELASIAKAMGGCPLSEHGVGKHPLKKTMLAQFWGPEVIGMMRTIKRSFDPSWTLNRGVFFDPE